MGYSHWKANPTTISRTLALGDIYCLSLDGSLIVSRSVDLTVRVWDAVTRRPALPPLEGHKHHITSVAFHLMDPVSRHNQIEELCCGTQLVIESSRENHAPHPVPDILQARFRRVCM